MPRTQEASARGGRNRWQGIRGAAAVAVTLTTAADVLAIVQREIGEQLAMPRSDKRARTVGFLCNVALRAIDVSDMETRLRALERRFAELAQPRAA